MASFKAASTAEDVVALSLVAVPDAVVLDAEEVSEDSSAEALESPPVVPEALAPGGGPGGGPAGLPPPTCPTASVPSWLFVPDAMPADPESWARKAITAEDPALLDVDVDVVLLPVVVPPDAVAALLVSRVFFSSCAARLLPDPDTDKDKAPPPYCLPCGKLAHAA